MRNQFAVPWSLDHGQLRNCKGEALAYIPIYPDGIGGPDDMAIAQLMFAAPEMLDALRHAVITLHFYAIWMNDTTPGTSYPAGIDAEEAARVLVKKLAPGLDMWGLPLPKEERHEQ